MHRSRGSPNGFLMIMILTSATSCFLEVINAIRYRIGPVPVVQDGYGSCWTALVSRSSSRACGRSGGGLAQASAGRVDITFLWKKDPLTGEGLVDVDEVGTSVRVC